FQMQTTPLTQAQITLILGDNPSNFKRGDDGLSFKGVPMQPNHPAEQISWKTTMERVATRLSELDPEWNYSLPTDAQWEFMARAGTRTAYSFGDDPSELPDYGRFGGTGGNSESRTHPVIDRLPNPYGIYAMHGYVWEWTRDWYTENPVGGIDPTGAE